MRRGRYAPVRRPLLTYSRLGTPKAAAFLTHAAALLTEAGFLRLGSCFFEERTCICEESGRRAGFSPRDAKAGGSGAPDLPDPEGRGV